MPTTPVGQIPYPQRTDRPVISSDIKNLATVADTWTSSLDTAFQGRMSAITGRLNGVHTRVTGTNNNLTALSAVMNTGDTAITSEQNALSAVESRLAAQDTSANALQTRYTNDLNELSTLENKAPKGVKAMLTTAGSWGEQSVVAAWVTQKTFSCDGPGAVYRIFYGTTFWDGDTGFDELRLAWGQGTTANWWNFISRLIIGQTPSYTMPIPFSLFGVATGMPAGQVTIGVGTAGNSQPPSGFGQILNIQQMTSA